MNCVRCRHCLPATGRRIGDVRPNLSLQRPMTHFDRRATLSQAAGTLRSHPSNRLHCPFTPPHPGCPPHFAHSPHDRRGRYRSAASFKRTIPKLRAAVGLPASVRRSIVIAYLLCSMWKPGLPKTRPLLARHYATRHSFKGSSRNGTRRGCRST